MLTIPGKTTPTNAIPSSVYYFGLTPLHCQV
jgi:hypothetical protein